MKILLIGGSGQIGHELNACLPALGNVVVPGRPQLDMSNVDQVRGYILTVRPDVIINSAAYTDVDGAQREPEIVMRVNGEAPGVIAEAARDIGASLVHYSSDYVFDGEKGRLYLETDVPNPVNVYGKSKLAGERAIQESGARHVILRTSWVYSLRRKNFLMSVLLQWRRQQSLQVVEDQFGTPTSARTVALATCALLRQTNCGLGDHALLTSETYHLAAGGLASRFEFAQLALAQINPSAAQEIEAVTSEKFPTLAQRPANSGLDNSRFRERFCELPDWQSDLRSYLETEEARSAVRELLEHDAG